MSRIHTIWVLLLSAAIPFVVVPALAAEERVDGDQQGYDTVVRPFLQEHCVSCHGSSVTEAGFRIDQLSPDMSQLRVAERWHELLNRMNKAEMPPQGEPAPSAEQQAAVSDWITRQLQRAARAAQSTGGKVVLRRLNRAEYSNTIRDLMGIDIRPAQSFPADPPAFGFDNIGSALSVTPLHFEKYLAAARDVVDRAIVTDARPVSWEWHMEVETAHPSNQFAGRDSAGDFELWTKDPHYQRHRYLIKGGGTRVERGWLIQQGARDEGSSGFRWFRIPASGTYRLRIRAAGRIPTRREVEESVQRIRWRRKADDLRKEHKSSTEIEAARETWLSDEWPEYLEETRRAFYYNYGAPRMKIVDGNGVVVHEISVEAPPDMPQVYEVRHEFERTEDRELASVEITNGYQVPSEVTNHWFLSDPEFARPELWIDWVELEGPYTDDWPPTSQQQLLFESPSRNDEMTYAREVLDRFMTRAFRRPVNDVELQAMLQLFAQTRHAKASFEDAIKVPLMATLCSPHFLYLVEPSAHDAHRDLDNFEVASRLSYFLWSSMPDEELFRLALEGKLSDHDVLRQQVRRMLLDDKSRALVSNFAGQWLGLRDVGANPPTRDLFPRYDDHLQEAMVRESEAFFAEILDHDLDVMNFVSSEFVTINERLARFYEIAGVTGDHMRRVAIEPQHHRGGVLTQASVLTTTSNGTRTSPVVRGKWILANVLGDPPPPPPPDAGDIQPVVPGIDKATVRVRLEHHRSIAACARCHAKIDPLGFALENFSADGAWRDREGFGYKGRVGPDDPPIDASGQLPDGTPFHSFEEFRQLLRKEETAFLRCLAEKLTTYALGRGLEYSDDAEVSRLVHNMQQNNRTLRGLIEDIVTSRMFLTN